LPSRRNTKPGDEKPKFLKREGEEAALFISLETYVALFVAGPSPVYGKRPSTLLQDRALQPRNVKNGLQLFCFSQCPKWWGRKWRERGNEIVIYFTIQGMRKGRCRFRQGPFLRALCPTGLSVLNHFPWQAFIARIIFDHLDKPLGRASLRPCRWRFDSRDALGALCRSFSLVIVALRGDASIAVIRSVTPVRAGGLPATPRGSVFEVRA
jgi:hypothetical protein